MKHCNHTQLIKRLSAATLISFFMAGTVVASDTIEPQEAEPAEVQSNEEQANQESATPPAEDDEVFVFYETKPMGFYRRQWERAEQNFYDKYNEYVDVDKFRIKCRKETPVGTRIGKKVCYPQYLLSRIATETNFANRAGLPLPSVAQVEQLASDEKAEFVKYQEELVKKHPELLATLVNFGVAKKAYDDKKAGVEAESTP